MLNINTLFILATSKRSYKLTCELLSEQGTDLLHTAEHFEWILEFEPCLGVTPLVVLLGPQGVVQQRVLRVNEVVQRAHREAVLLPAGEQHREPLAVARRPHAVEARRHAPVRGDLRARRVHSNSAEE